MSEVWKFDVPMPTSTGRAFIDIPAQSRLLSVGMQDDQMIVWALVELGQPEAVHRLIVANTGQEIPGLPPHARFIGTATSSNGIVWHVWDGDAAA